MNGWIKWHLDGRYNDMFRNDWTAWHLFEYLCLCAYEGKPQGTVVTSRHKIANTLGGNNNTIYKALKRLENAKMVTTSVTNKYTTIRICNWARFQYDGNSSGNNKVTTEQQQSNTLYKNKIKNKEIDTNVSSSTDVDLKALFSELIGLLGFTDAVKYTEGRRRKLQSRVRSSSPDELRRAAQAIADDAYMQGDNPSGRRYGDIDYLIRSDEQVDKWIQRSETKLKDLKEYI